LNGNKKTFISEDKKYFYKQYSKNEFYFLKMLHGVDSLHLDTITDNNTEYIEMPAGNVISIDTIPKNHRNSIRHIIINNIPFMLSQVNYLNELGIYYSDAMQWLYYNNKMYLIDMDAAYMTKIDYNYNNYDLFINFLSAFNIDSSYITEALHYLLVLQSNDDIFLLDEDKNIYNRYHNNNLQCKHVYYSRNQRHIQININNIHIYGEYGNMLLTETLLNPELMKEWELIKIA
jgi:hypothetical protein